MSEVQVVAPQMKSSTPHTLVHIPELDGLRGIASLMVFFHHVCYTSIDLAHWCSPVRYLGNLSEFGSYGVDFFFVLSGFLISSLLIEARTDSGYYHNFYWKRALRILPLYAVCLLVILIFLPSYKSYVLLSALFIVNFAHLFQVTGIGPFWTLAIEEQFYLLWPTVVRTRSIEAIRRWSLSIAIGAIALRLVAACFGHHNYYFTFFHCDGLAFGAYLACTFAQRHTNQPRRTGRSLTILALSCVALFFTARPLASSHSLVINSFAAAMLQTGVVFLSIVIVAFLLDHSGSKILCFLRTGFFPFFGTISYALYMIHLYVMQAYDHLRGPLTNDDLPAYLIRFFTIAAVTVTLCLLSRYLIELPAASLRRYVLKPAKRIVNDRRP